MSDGAGVYEAHSPEAVVDLLRNGQGVFAISLDAVYTDLEDSVTPRRETAGRRAAAGGLVSAQPDLVRRCCPSRATPSASPTPPSASSPKLLDFYGIEWQYEPTSFDIEWDKEGRVAAAVHARLLPA